MHLDVSPFEFFSRFGGSVYDRHCPAGASVVVFSSGCRRPTNGRGFMTWTRSVQHPQRAESITSSSTLGSQSVPARDHQHATVLHCTHRALNVCGDTETGLTQPPIPAYPVSRALALDSYGKRSSANTSLCSLSCVCSITRGIPSGGNSSRRVTITLAVRRRKQRVRGNEGNISADVLPGTVAAT